MTREDPETGGTFQNGAGGSDSEHAFTETMDYCARSVGRRTGDSRHARHCGCHGISS